MAAGCREGREQTVAVLALAVRVLPGTDSTVTFGGSQLLHGLQPGPVLPVQGLPLACRVIAGLPGLVTGIGFALAGARQLSVGSLNQRRGLRTGLVAFRPCRLSDPGGFRGLLPSTDPGGLSISAGTCNRLGQLPPRLFSRLARLTGPGLGRFPAPVRGGGLLQRGSHLLLRLRGLRLGRDSPRLSAAPGRFRLGHLHGHHLRIQRRSLLPGHLEQGPGLRDQRRQRTERITRLLRRHRNTADRGPRSVMETPRAHVTAEQASPAAASRRNQVPAARPLAHTLAGVPGHARHGQPRAGAHFSHGRFLSFLITISLQGNEEENAPVNRGDRETPGHEAASERRHATHARPAGPSPATTAQHPAACGKAATSHTAPDTPAASGRPRPARYRCSPAGSPSRSRVTTARRCRRPAPSRTRPAHAAAAVPAPNTSVASAATRPGIPSGNSTFKCGTPSTCRNA
jgi:hypothetical protein